MKLPTGLTKVEKALLGELVESPYWRPLLKVLALKQMEISQTGLMSSSSMEELKYSQGQIFFSKWLESTLRYNQHKENSRIQSEKETIQRGI